MSVNTAIQDLVVRVKRAQQAGAIIYSGITSEQAARNTSMSNFATSSIEAEVGTEGPDSRMSPVRRTFCLLVTFDIIFTFILWVIYTQLKADNIAWAPYVEEVLHYSIKHSMFDIVMAAASRFVLLILAYALFRIQHWWMVAVTTFSTCAFLLAKCFIFKFSRKNNNSNPLSYALLLVSFVICWIETWLLDFKVLPQERTSQLRETLSTVVNERTPLLSGRDNLQPDNASTIPDEFHSPIDSPNDSDEDADEQFVFHKGGPGQLDSKSKLDRECLRQAKETWDLVYSWYGTEKDWKIECGTNPIDGCVRGKKSNGGYKIFLLQAYLDINPHELWEELVFKAPEMPKWNPTVLESRTIHPLTDTCDISYYVAAAGAKGLVKSRDFVVVRRWGNRRGIYMSVGVSITYPGMPPVKKHVRGENGPGGVLLAPLPGESNKCEFTWYCNTNLKGMLPHKLVDTAMGGMLMDYLKYLRFRVEQINKQRGR